MECFQKEFDQMVAINKYQPLTSNILRTVLYLSIAMFSVILHLKASSISP